MKRQAYQHPELRDANDVIIQEGTYGKNSPLANSDNTGGFDYINNNLEALYDMITSSKVYVSSQEDLPAVGDVAAVYIASDTGTRYYWDPAAEKYVESESTRKLAEEATAARDAALVSQQAAAASEQAAKESETSAKTSEENARSSETAAAASKEAVQASEANAKTSEENAKSSETAAAASQTAAKASETSAAESAAAAALAATQATAGQINADWNAESGVAQILNKPTIDTTVTDGSMNLVTSGAVAKAIAAAITNIIDGNGVSY